MDNFGLNIFAAFLNQINSFITTVFPKLMDSFDVFAYAFVLLYIVVVGILLMKGTFGKEKSIEFAASMIILVILGPLMTTGGFFKWFVQPVIGSVMDIAGFFVNAVHSDLPGGSGLSALFAGMDEMSFKLFDILFKIEPDGNFLTNAWKYLRMGSLVLLLLIIYSAAYVTFLALMIMGFFSMYVLFIVGGVCIFFAAFKQTRFIFFAWLKGIINYALLVIFASIIMSICYFGLADTVESLIDLNTVNIVFTKQYWACVCWSLLTIAMLLKAPDFASQLSGGMAGSTSGIAGGLAVVGGGGAAVAGKAAQSGSAYIGKGAAAAAPAAVSGMQRAYSQIIGLPKKFM